MPQDESAPPSGGSEAEEAAWEMATAETLRARGELAEAANWYRRAANHLMEAGEDERAVTVAKLAAELAALDDAGRPVGPRTSGQPPARSAAPPAGLSKPAPKPAPAASAAPAAGTRAGNDRISGVPTTPPQASTSFRSPAGGPKLNPAASRAPAALGAGASRPSAKPATAAPVPSVSRTPVAASRAPAPAASRAAPSRAPQPATPATDDSKTAPVDLRAHGVIPPAEPLEDRTHRVAINDLTASIGAMVDEAVSRIDEVPSVPLTGAPEPRASQRPPSYSPQRLAESEQIATRLPALPLFGDFATERLREVSRQASIVRYNAGDYLCESGAPEGPMFVLIEGTALVGLPGSDAPAGVVGAGDYVGEISALFGGPRTATVLAQGTVEAIALAPSLVRGLAHDFPPFRETLEGSIRERLFESLPHLAPMFQRFDSGERKELFRMFDVVAVPEGALILTEGEVADALCVIGAGEAEVYGGPFGTRPHRARVGEALGLASMVSGEASAASCRALRSMLIARLKRSRFRDALARAPGLADAVADVGAPGRGVVF